MNSPSDDQVTETKVHQKLAIKPKIKDPRVTSNLDFSDNASATSNIRAKTATSCTNNQQKNLESMEYDSDDIYDEDDFIEDSSKRGTPRKKSKPDKIHIK